LIELYTSAAAFILITLVLGLIRIFRGPTKADRILTAQLIGTNGVAIILLLSEVMQMQSLIDVALIFALLSAVTATVFVRRLWQDSDS
jgi:multicomponent Na+:H+ antiporter subunit F